MFLGPRVNLDAGLSRAPRVHRQIGTKPDYPPEFSSCPYTNTAARAANTDSKKSKSFPTILFGCVRSARRKPLSKWFPPRQSSSKARAGMYQTTARVRQRRGRPRAMEIRRALRIRAPHRRCRQANLHPALAPRASSFQQQVHGFRFPASPSRSLAASNAVLKLMCPPSARSREPFFKRWLFARHDKLSSRDGEPL